MKAVCSKHCVAYEASCESDDQVLARLETESEEIGGWVLFKRKLTHRECRVIAESMRSSTPSFTQRQPYWLLG